MIISVINHTNGQISDEQLEVAIRAINRQIREDFEPYWSLGATLRLEGRSQASSPANKTSPTCAAMPLFICGTKPT
jgi:hypothetical protein